jgi:hypothetical protein
MFLARISSLHFHSSFLCDSHKQFPRKIVLYCNIKPSNRVTTSSSSKKIPTNKMNAPPIISGLLAVTPVCAVGQQWLSPMENPAVIRVKSLSRSTGSTSIALDGVHPPLQVSSTCTTPPIQQQHRGCFVSKKTTAAADNTVMSTSDRRRSVTFDEVVRVRTVSYTTSVTLVNRLWYQNADYERFRTKIGKLVTLAREYQQQHGQDVYLPGMEKFMVDDTDSAVASDIPSTAQLRSQAIGSVLMEQFCQRQQRYSNQGRISALYRLTTMQAQILAWERADILRNSCIVDDVDADDTI